MAKKINYLALTAALMVAMLSLAAANTYTTTVTTTIDDDEAGVNPGQQQQCRQEVQGRQFRSCQRYLQQGQQGRGGGYLLEMKRDGGDRQREELRQCCEELRNVEEQCRCEAIKQAVREQQQEGGSYRGEGIQEVYEKARDLPRHCQFQRPQQCQLRGVFV